MGARCWALAALLCAATCAAADDAARYAEIRKLINANRHLSGHLVMAVDARTIKEARKRISAGDIAVLVRMLGDKDYGVASAASGLLTALGNEARPVLLEAAQGRDLAVAGQARDALQLMDACYNDPRAMNADLCPRMEP
jgi:hypothetical protein